MNQQDVPDVVTEKPYTPTTREIRAGYAWRDNEGSKTYEVEFDRWLAGVKAEAWEEGYAQGSADSYDSRLDADNPYRPGETQ